MPKDKELEIRFNNLLPRIKIILAKRKNSWTLSTLAWEDVESILMARLWQQLANYDPLRPFDNWANRLISNALSNLLRDNIFRFARPCIASGPSGGLCSFNHGGDKCGFTESGKQCSECPLYKKWAAKKESAYNIKASLPLDHHDTEVQNIQEDFVDYDGAKTIIDQKIIVQLNKHEATIYHMLYIEHLSMEEVSLKMKYKTQTNSKISQVLRKMVNKFKRMAVEIIRTEDLG